MHFKPFADNKRMISKKSFISLIFILSSTFIFADVFFSNIAYELGVGTGYVFYGKKDTRNLIDSISNHSQFLVDANGLVLLPLETQKRVFLNVGFDSVFDAHWGSGDHIYLWDYSVLFGFRIYPKLASLCFDINYAVGRRTDFCDLTIGSDENEEHIKKTSSTPWGNGFIFGVYYDFSYKKESVAPIVGISYKHIPRGNSSDNILNVSFKLKY